MTNKKETMGISFCIRAYNEEWFIESKLTDLIQKLKKAKAESEIAMMIQRAMTTATKLHLP